jgi:hypothetical protein
VHRLSAALTATILAALSLMLSGPAHGGGPTSALLSVPGEGATASLYYTDPEYDALADLVGIESGTGTGRVDESGGGHENGPGVTVTWLIHDVMPWRVDHIYLQGKEAPWIATQVSNDGGVSWESPVVWHQPASPAQLVALLDRLGGGEASRDTGAFSGVAGAPLPAPTEPAPQVSEPVASWDAGLWWGVGGLAAGVLLTVLAVGLWRSRAAAESSTGSGAECGELPRPPGAEEVSWPTSRA